MMDKSTTTNPAKTAATDANIQSEAAATTTNAAGCGSNNNSNSSNGSTNTSSSNNNVNASSNGNNNAARPSGLVRLANDAQRLERLWAQAAENEALKTLTNSSSSNNRNSVSNTTTSIATGSGTGTGMGAGATNAVINLNISTTTGGNFAVSVESHISVENLKKIIAKKLKVAKDRICLLHREK